MNVGFYGFRPVHAWSTNRSVPESNLLSYNSLKRLHITDRLADAKLHVCIDPGQIVQGANAVVLDQPP